MDDISATCLVHGSAKFKILKVLDLNDLIQNKLRFLKILFKVTPFYGIECGIILYGQDKSIHRKITLSWFLG